ncbi:MAG: YggS family pyridoxal phosphate-dependent enzyme [Prevotellaceae bacterium]|nr:YggS family pyridoxal phosphate-dependent enzyme [Prevotellaceae bacterium]MDY2749373.1 YggS family pyridoxal phosphate-dependent enzyme [Prevotella sp.]
MISNNLQEVRHTLDNGVCLVAVSKYHPVEAVQEAYASGQRIFGESREQELRIKHDSLPKDIQWHFIGHLQTNKVKYIAPYIAMIETVDSLKLMKEIDRQGVKCGRVIDILLELHLAQEDTKSGMTLSDCLALLDGGEWREMRNIRIRGIMMMASNTDDTEEIRREFLLARDFFNAVKAKHFANDTAFDTKSYGMSHDYLLAQQCGSNHVRVGSRIFG